MTSGKVIGLSEYSDRCLALAVSPKPPSVVFALDVIGDPEATARNCEAMTGVGAVPTFHYGSPWHYLEDLGRRYLRIALGGLVKRGKGGHGGSLGWSDRLRWLE